MSEADRADSQVGSLSRFNIHWYQSRAEPYTLPAPGELIRKDPVPGMALLCLN